VLATGSSRNRDFVLNLGADAFIDYTVSHAAEAVTGVDLVLDTVGAATTMSLVPTLREGGTLVTIAYPPETPPPLPRLWVKPLVMRPDAKQLAHISELVASRGVRVEISQLFHLDEVQRAHTASELGHGRGKIVLTIGTRCPPASAQSRGTGTGRYSQGAPASGADRWVGSISRGHE
jgi:NADPH:quinone reductase-like Zn-dependent oxidoreductase